jgi:hypothetical protein
MFDTPVIGRPQTVVSDSDGVLVSYWPIGTKWFGPDFADRETAMDEVVAGSVRWKIKTWQLHNVLEIVRPDDPYSVLGFWNEDGKFVGWYINLQDPMRRTSIGFDSRDHYLDLIVGEDLASWIWKDEHELEWGVQMGFFTPDEAIQFRQNGEAVVDLVKNGRAWWGEWRDFVPDPSWAIPELPHGWDVM